MSRHPARKTTRLALEQLETRDTPSSVLTETFDTTSIGALPGGWTQWSSSANAYATANLKAYTTPNSLSSSAPSNVTARTWQTVVTDASTAVTANVFVDKLVPTELIARGANLNGTSPTFYAASIVRGTTLQVIKSVGGVRTVLGSVTSVPYVSSVWLQVSLKPVGNQIKGQIFNPATNQYLNSSGQWQSGETAAVTVTDNSITAAGLIGVNRPTSYADTVSLDNFVSISPDPSSVESFDSVANGTLPTGWKQYFEGNGKFGVASGLAISGSRSLVSAGTTPKRSLAWVDAPAAGANAEVTVAINLNNPAGAQVIVRGSNLNGVTPTYYAVEVGRGVAVQVSKMINGTPTVLSNGPVLTGLPVNSWVKVSLRVQGNQIKVRIVRADTNQSLSPGNVWTTGSVWYRELTDNSITTGQYVGVGKSARIVGSATFDDFTVINPANDTTPPTVSVTTPANGATLTGTVAVTALAADNMGVSRVEFRLDGSLKATISQSPYTWNFNTTTAVNGAHTLQVKAIDSAGNFAISTLTLTTQNSNGTSNPGSGIPTIPKHYTHIRVAALAYSGLQITGYETALLQNSIDLVVPNPTYLSTINSVAPNTPQLIYTNVSNLYEGLITDWLTYADAKGLDRESAFYHVAQATSFSGGSPSSQPVNWLWNVSQGTTDLTSNARSSATQDVPLGGAVGSATNFGYPDKFRELNFTMSTLAAGGWSGVFEYVSAVDAAGNATGWSMLPLASNGTNGFGQGGRITFDPPSNWKPSKTVAGNQLFMVRVRTLTAGTSPVASTVFGRDYVNANGAEAGVMPAFDSAADTNSDGYLNDWEYGNRAAGKDGRFRYESRLFYPFYGQMRFAINPSSQGVKDWAADFHVRVLQSQPLADGFFADNSDGKSPLNGAVTLESAANYSADYGTMLQSVSAAISPRWVLANTSGGNPSVGQVVQRVAASFEEFALRPMTATWSSFFDTAGMVADRLASANGPYVILDTLPAGGSTTDPRTQIASLAYYYLLADPTRTFVMFNGGYAPASSWTEHWVPAAAYNVGQPSTTWSTWATGNDPANSALKYNVYRRNYAGAVVLYKPLSYQSGVGTGTTANNTATVHALGGSYRPLNADGSLGAIVSSVSLRNGEGAILIPI